MKKITVAPNIKNGILCSIASIPFLICGIYEILNNVTRLLPLTFSFIGIFICIIIGIYSLLEEDSF